MELLAKPQGHRRHERSKSRGRVRRVGLQQAIELQKGLVVEGDVIKLPGRDARLPQAVVQGVLRKPMVMLLPREPLFLGRRDDLPVTNNAGCTVVIEGRDTENVHFDRRTYASMLSKDDRRARGQYTRPPPGRPIRMDGHGSPRPGEKSAIATTP